MKKKKNLPVTQPITRYYIFIQCNKSDQINIPLSLLSLFLLPFIRFCASEIIFDPIDGGGPEFESEQIRSTAMTRRCSHCNQNGHNSRTCPNRGVKLFGVRLTEGSIRKSASMGNLSHYSGSGLSGLGGTGSNNPGSPGDGHDHGVGDGYASEDFVPGSSSSRERKKGISLCVCVFQLCGTFFCVLFTVTL